MRQLNRISISQAAARLLLVALAGGCICSGSFLPVEKDKVEAFLKLEKMLSVSAASSKGQSILEMQDNILLEEKASQVIAESASQGATRGHLKDLLEQMIHMGLVASVGDKQGLATLSESFGSELLSVERQLSIELVNLNTFIARLFERVVRQEDAQRRGQQTEQHNQEDSNSSSLMDKFCDLFGCAN